MSLQQSHNDATLTELDRAYCEYWCYFYVLEVAPAKGEMARFRAIEKRMVAIAVAKRWKRVEL